MFEVFVKGGLTASRGYGCERFVLEYHPNPILYLGLLFCSALLHRHGIAGIAYCQMAKAIIAQDKQDGAPSKATTQFLAEHLPSQIFPNHESCSGNKIFSLIDMILIISRYTTTSDSS
jgi:hypothetical protein